MSLSGEEPQKLTFGDGKVSPQLEWIVYAARVADKPVLMKMPVAGSAPGQWTDFKAGRIYNYARSRDSKQLVCVRGADVSDVVLINGFR